jgi:MSHA pilin protein MshD
VAATPYTHVQLQRIPAACHACANGFAGGTHPRRGLTLIEAAISVILVATLLVGAVGVMGSVARARQLQNARSRRIALAQALMAEIVQAHYVDPDVSGNFGTEFGEWGGTRTDFDDVDDYDGWSASPPEAKGGTALTGYEGWTRQVAVHYVRSAPPDDTVAGDLGLKRITVSVTDDLGKKTTLVSLRSANGAFELAPEAAATVVTWVGVELQIGDEDATRINSAAVRLNYPTDGSGP